MKALIEKYNAENARRDWARGFTVPPVPTCGWDPVDFDNWLASRHPLPPFPAWMETIKPQRVALRVAGRDMLTDRLHAAMTLRRYRAAGAKLVRVRVRSACAVVRLDCGKETVVLHYKSTLPAC